MSSTPSASALSAVLRCRGKIWTRNPPTKRPTTAAHSLGLGSERAGPGAQSRWERPKQAQSAGTARPAAPGAPVLARSLTLHLPGGDKCSKVIRLIQTEARRTVQVRELCGSAAGVWKLTVTSPRCADGPVPCLVPSGWFTLRRACLSLSALLLRLTLLCARSGHEDEPPHLLRHQEEKDVPHDPLLAIGRRSTRAARTGPDRGSKDRPT